ncbi:unnamed protein product [Prunus armeniaca]|uniref:Uncharacterized protein n=1 Tax=Prunus armeniaca TaxID=36596 RepID=A0A6J5VBY2_PRUAR|nr:unnamed protein product [Prunus armeniaca]
MKNPNMSHHFSDSSSDSTNEHFWDLVDSKSDEELEMLEVVALQKEQEMWKEKRVNIMVLSKVMHISTEDDYKGTKDSMMIILLRILSTL